MVVLKTYCSKLDRYHTEVMLFVVTGKSLSDQCRRVFSFSFATFVVSNTVSSFSTTQQVKNKYVTNGFLQRSNFITVLTWVQSGAVIFRCFTLSLRLLLTFYLQYLIAEWCHTFNWRHEKMFWRISRVLHVYKKNKLIFRTKNVKAILLGAVSLVIFSITCMF